MQTTHVPSDPDFVTGYRVLSEDIAAGIAVLSCRRGTKTHAITVDSYLDVSYDPPTMAVSVYEGSRIQESLERTTHFALSVLTRAQRPVAQWLGEPGQPLHGLLDNIPTTTTPTGIEIVDCTVAWFELETEKSVEIATHVLTVGRVTACGRAMDEAEATPPPLVRWGRQYGTFTE